MREAANAGEPVSYGDCTRRETLLAAGLARASVVIITFADRGDTLRTLHRIRESAPGVPVVARAREEDDAKALLAAPTYVADAVWFKYRQHPQSATAESAAAGADDKARLRYLGWLSRYLAAQRADPQARQAVRSTIADLRLRMAKNVVRRLLGKAPR